MLRLDNKKREKQVGISLIEVVVAVFILMMGITAVLSIFPLGLKVGKTSERATIASFLGQEKMEEYLSKQYDEITDESRVVVSDYSLFEREVGVSYVDPNDSLAETGSDLGIKKIRVFVYWPAVFAGSEKSLEIVTLIAER